MQPWRHEKFLLAKVFVSCENRDMDKAIVKTASGNVFVLHRAFVVMDGETEAIGHRDGIYVVQEGDTIRFERES